MSKGNPLLGPQQELRLTKIRVENGDGQELTECQACGGAGVMGEAEKFIDGKNTAEGYTERKRIAGKLIQQFKRNKWSVRQFSCEVCKGAGMVLKG